MNATTKNALIGIGSALVVGAIGWIATSTVSHSSDIATIKAVHEVQYKQIDESLKEMKESQQRLEQKLDRYFRRSP